MKIETKEVHNIRMHVIEGELDHGNKQAFLADMMQRVGKHSYEVLNLWGLDFMDSGGVAALVQLATHLRDRKIPLWLYKVNPLIKKVLENTHVSVLFKFTNSPDIILGTIVKDYEKKTAEV